MDEDPSVRQLLADQMKPAKEPDEIPPPKSNGSAGDLVAGRSGAKPTGDKIAGATVPDFRGKSMRDVVEESSANGIEVMIEGSGVARAQVPLPGSPLRQGEQIRIVFTR
jgi:hypothetical protein